MTLQATPQRNSSVQVPASAPYAGRTPGAGARAERPSEIREVKQGDPSRSRRGAKGPSACDRRPQMARRAIA